MKRFDVFKNPVSCPANSVTMPATPLFYASWKDEGYGHWSNSTASWKDRGGWSNSTGRWKDNYGWSNSTASWKDSGGWSNSSSGK